MGRARCRHCDRPFKNRQAVRRHLGYCKIWQDKKAGIERAQGAPLSRWKCTKCGTVVVGSPDICRACGNTEWTEL